MGRFGHGEDLLALAAQIETVAHWGFSPITPAWGRARIGAESLSCGCELVEMCDIGVAAASARFCRPEIALAAMPGAGGTQRLTRVVGKHVAMDLLLTGRALSADEALAAGLVSRVVSDEELEATAMSVALLVASYSNPVACRIKASVNKTQAQLDSGLAMEREQFHKCFSEHDFREGLTAFTEKRKAKFQNR